MWQLLEQDDSELTWLAAHLLAHAGSVMRQADSAAAARCRPAMRKLCLEGSRRAAKAAVRSALLHLIGHQCSPFSRSIFCLRLLEGLSRDAKGGLYLSGVHQFNQSINLLWLQGPGQSAGAW